ncbi:hypothetical protein AGMMS4952_14800 [Spirochaetia bacterium]|nr:hypothetical protein AGMMS4952_14760 [Spirochaetia bacterium]GHV29288.1 hypothetical protein AGMMS4952_14800 [Spirochaetia bacterium]
MSVAILINAPFQDSKGFYHGFKKNTIFYTNQLTDTETSPYVSRKVTYNGESYGSVQRVQ